MIKYLKEQEKNILDLLKADSKKTDWEKVLVNHRNVVFNLQHERLIHLLVTLTIALIFIFSMWLTLIYQIMVLMLFDALVLILLVPYLFHYYKLENGVQRLYRLDKEIEAKIDKF